MATENEPAEWVTFVSYDGFEFVLLRSIATRSEMVRRMLNPKSGFKEAVTGICRFEQIDGIVLEKVVEYLYYNARYEGMSNVPDMEIPPELSLELALAAEYLNC